jgi:signal peptidase I
MSKVGKEILEWIKTIAVALIIAFIITTFIRPTLVRGYSMYPTLEENDYLIISRMAYNNDIPDRGNIIVFKSHLIQENGKGKDLVKRVIAIPGDHLVIKNSEVYINNKLRQEPYISEAYTAGDIDIVIPEGSIFAMGDNRENSMDSRDPQVGLVSIDDIMGKVVLRLYPFNKIGSVE